MRLARVTAAALVATWLGWTLSHPPAPVRVDAHVSLLPTWPKEPASPTTSVPPWTHSQPTSTGTAAQPITVSPAAPTISPAPVQLDGGTWTPNDGTGVTWTTFVLWSRVAVCEEGLWVGSSGAAYPDSLGISAQNWYFYGGTSDVTPDAQIVIAQRIQQTPPDQAGCSAW